MISDANSAVVEVEPIELETPKQSFRTSAFRGIRRPLEDVAKPRLSEETLQSSRSEKIFTSALVGQKLGSESKEDLELRLAELMKSPALRAFMQAARSLAADLNCSEQDAVTNILESLDQVDNIWSQILSREGLQRLSDPNSL